METGVSPESDRYRNCRPTTSVVTSTSTDFDVVNLSSQLVSMELLTHERTKASKKRVRFTLPDGDSDEETSCTKSKRKGSPVIRPSPRIHKTYHFRKKIGHGVHTSERRRKPLKLDRYKSIKDNSTSFLSDANMTPGNAEKEKACLKTTDISDKIENKDAVVMDKNQNCAVKSEIKKPNGSRVVLRKSKSDSALHEASHRPTCKTVKKRKTVVAKKSCLRGKQNRNSNATRKRKCNNTGRYSKAVLKTVKKRKVSSTKPKAKKNSKNLKIKKSTSKTRKKSSTSRSASKVKQIRDKIKKAAEKVRKAKIAKHKLTQKRLKERLKRTAQKKLAMKRSLAKKRKENKKKSRLTNKKRKTNCKCVQSKKKRRRKIKIILIKRELDIVEPLRISLLKYLTFQNAIKQSYECCRKYCWDKWEEVEMEDIIDDHD